MVRQIGRALLGAVLGLVAGAAMALALAIVAGWLFGISQREGAYAMGVVFTLMPLGGLIGALAGAVWLLLRGRR